MRLWCGVWLVPSGAWSGFAVFCGGRSRGAGRLCPEVLRVRLLPARTAGCPALGGRRAQPRLRVIRPAAGLGLSSWREGGHSPLMARSSFRSPPSRIVALLALAVVVKVFPGPAALVGARLWSSDRCVILSWSCGLGSPSGFQLVVGYGSVCLQACHGFLSPSTVSGPVPLAITLLVEAVVWFCTTLYRGYVTPYRAVYGHLYCMG